MIKSSADILATRLYFDITSSIRPAEHKREDLEWLKRPLPVTLDALDKERKQLILQQKIVFLRLMDIDRKRALLQELKDGGITS